MTPILLQLIAIRAQVDALIAAVGGNISEPVEEGCPHPDDRRVPASNMGEPPAFYCQVCKQIVQGQA